MRLKFRVIAAIVLASLAFTGCEKKPVDNPLPGPETVDADEDRLESFDVAAMVSKATIVKEVISSSDVTVAKGVMESDFTVTLTSGQKENIFIVTVDLDRDDIYACTVVPTSSIPSGAWPRKTLSNMATSLNTSGSKVLAMINADFWNTSTFIPRGPVHTDGFLMKTTFDVHSNKQQGISYVGCTSDDKMVIGYSADYLKDSEASFKLPNVTGSGIMLVEKGQKVDNSSWPADNRHPRTAIGYTKDGIVYLFCVDGRDAGVSEGMTYDDMGSIFAALGCEYAVNLDGGGSTQMLVYNPASGKLEIRNKPSDGVERAVIDAWAILQKRTI